MSPDHRIWIEETVFVQEQRLWHRAIKGSRGPVHLKGHSFAALHAQ